MRNPLSLSILVPLVLIAVAPLCHAYGANKPAVADIIPMEDKDRAKVDVAEQKLKLKLLEIEDQSSGNEEPSTSSCGSVNIGNLTNSTTGSNLVAPHDTTIIITGDVFNTANCGR